MKLRQEWHAFARGARSLDAQTTCVLVLCAILVVIQVKLGSRRFFLLEVAPAAWSEHRELLSWGWWFLIQCITGFLVPVLVLCAVFRRSARQAGLGRGDWRLAGTIVLLYLPLVTVGTWVLSDGASFQAAYPHFRQAIQSWRLFAFYHVMFLLYWVGWEYLWRGFVLFGTARVFGLYAILIQAIPFALLHLNKPMPELLLSVAGGIVLGAVVWRCRAFWVAVPIHALQMLILDLWCVLRIRTGTEGIGLGVLRQLLTG